MTIEVFHLEEYLKHGYNRSKLLFTIDNKHNQQTDVLYKQLYDVEDKEYCMFKIL